MPMYVAHARENNDDIFFLTRHQTVEEVRTHEVGKEVNVLMVHRVEMPVAIEQMLHVLRAIDNTTNTCITEDLLALVFKSGYYVGKKNR